MRTSLLSCCKNSRSPPCAEVDGCNARIVFVFRIAELMGSIRVPKTGDGVGLDELLAPAAMSGALADSLLRENLLEKS